MIIGWPQGIYLALIILSAGIALARFGERKTDTYGFTELFVRPAITLGLLYWGGFFTGGC